MSPIIPSYNSITEERKKKNSIICIRHRSINAVFKVIHPMPGENFALAFKFIFLVRDTRAFYIAAYITPAPTAAMAPSTAGGPVRSAAACEVLVVIRPSGPSIWP